MDNDLKTFVRVVELGSFTAAADDLGVTPSAVSKLISRLEDRLGAALLNRTTRRVTPTSEGRTFHQRAMEILEAIEYAENEVSKSGTTPRGTLRINCVTGFAYHVLSRHLPAFLSKHPQISVELFVTDRVVDLLEENTDIGIRSGEVTSPNVVCRKIASYQRYIYASPEYLARRGAPKAPEDLAGHDCIVHRSKEHYKWPFLRDGAVTEHEIASKLVVDTAEAAFQFALEGGGITRIANFFADEAVRRGALVSLLEDFHAPDIVEISAIYHAVRYRHRMPKVRAFIDYLLENVQGYDKRSPPRDKR